MAQNSVRTSQNMKAESVILHAMGTQVLACENSSTDMFPAEQLVLCTVNRVHHINPNPDFGLVSGARRPTFDFRNISKQDSSPR